MTAVLSFIKRPRNFIDLTKQDFERLKVIRYAGHTIHGKSLWLCRCKCGREKVVQQSHLKNGFTRSCGCLHSEQLGHRNTERARTGYKDHPIEYKVWVDMKHRTNNPKNKFFYNYGGRGIKVCLGWQGSFFAFYADMGHRPSAKLTIERKDNDGHYSCGKCQECKANNWPANCCWATRAEQNSNTRHNHYLTYQGQTLTISQWALHIGICRDTITNRLKKGWPIERVLSPSLCPPYKRSNLSVSIAQEIRRRYQQGELQRDLAAAFQVSSATISNVTRNKRWQSID